MKKKIACCCLAVVAAGCSQMQGPSTPAAAPAARATATPAAAPPPAAAKGPREGMNSAGEVVDASKVSCGDGPKVKGINDAEGEILGKPAPGSKFGLLKIG